MDLDVINISGTSPVEENKPDNELLSLLRKRKEDNMKESAMALIAGGIGEALSGDTAGQVASFGNQLAMDRMKRGERNDDIESRVAMSKDIQRFKLGLKGREKPKPLTKSNVLEVEGPGGGKRYARVEEALGRRVPEDEKSRESEFKVGKEKFGREQKLRQQYLGTTKDFKTLQSSFGKIKTIALDQPSPAGDISLVFNYMKMLDPGSTVREGEQATAANARGLSDGMRTLYNRVMSGEKLTSSQRADFYNKAGQIYSSQLKNLEGVQGEFKDIAKRSGASPENVIINFGKDDLTVDKAEVAVQNGWEYLIITTPDGKKEAKPIRKVE